jgi:uncharacterized membrane protein
MFNLLIGALSVACGINGGVFFAFSTFVMRGLGALPPATGIAAMQSINILAVTPTFMTALFGTAIACVATGVYVAMVGVAAAPAVLAGAATYVIGTIVVTIAFNVPLNNALAALDPQAGDAAWIWARYRRQWVTWNHVRTASCLAASALFAYALAMTRT